MGGKIWISSALLYSEPCILRTLYNTMIMRYDNESGRIREDDRNSQEPLDEPCAVRVCVRVSIQSCM